MNPELARVFALNQPSRKTKATRWSNSIPDIDPHLMLQ